MAGMDQMYSYVGARTVAGIAPRPVFLPAVRPKMRCIMADIDQRYSCVNAWVVLLVKMQLALCPFFVDRPRCSASGPVWLRKTVMPRYSSWLVLAVFPSVVDSSERRCPCAFVCGYAYLGKDCACLFVVLVPVFTAVRIRVRIRRMGKDCACLSVVLVLIRHAVFPAAVHRP